MNQAGRLLTPVNFGRKPCRKLQCVLAFVDNIEEMSMRVNWPEEIVNAASAKTLTFFVGNGISRLSGAPAWGELFEVPEAVKALERLSIEKGTANYLDIANALHSHNEGLAWDSITRKLTTWNARAKTNLIHTILATVLRPASDTEAIMTSNVDDLLERVGGETPLSRRDIHYCHGIPAQPDTWIFSTSKYWAAFDAVSKAFQGSRNAILFLGYGHSVDDFDIAQAVLQQRRERYGKMFTLMSSHDTQRGDLVARLARQGVATVDYKLPNEVNTREREIHLLDALLQLAEQAGRHAHPKYPGLRQECTEELRQIDTRRAKATVILGLAGINRHLQLDQEIPSGGRRVSVKAKVRVEPGGPGYLVSKVVQAAGEDVFLVSKIAQDPDGRHVIASLGPANHGRPAGRIMTEFLHQVPADTEHDGFKTWESFILEPHHAQSHRVFIDRRIEIGERMELPSDLISRARAMVRNDGRRVMYFDKFFKDAVTRILQPQSENSKPLPEGVWTVYETGSEGDRYSGTSAKKFDEDAAYGFEGSLSTKGKPCINVVTASFRFARDYLATRGKLDKDDKYKPSYRKLIHHHDSSELLNAYKNKATARTEDEVIQKLVRDKVRLRGFMEAVSHGAQGFLRKHPLRLVVVTLHAHGCLVIAVGQEPGETPWCQHYPGVPVKEPRQYTASAGDVFRGALVSALNAAQQKGLSAQDCMRRDLWDSIAALCNECASMKVASQTFEDALPRIGRKIDDWQNALAIPS
ncbi:hypothetical protein [Variovorax sp. JS1663]|uniref:hypothetical protein n=1 Tax=Variovorax sp. JS1663 TaxID=1851577 RepID=UPI000B696957|nr:hypothetical protein [Variovorax sp. JS1663]OUM03734.1 hypothetical protein A8M77_04270 [Variovorax sp. JS1663]